MSAKALVGPLPTIHFQDGTKVAYEPPRDTRDKRYSACRDHHAACDCREALLAEEIGEMRGELASIKRTVSEALKEHVTWAFTADGEWDFGRLCRCAGCAIAREGHLRTLVDQKADGVPTHRPVDRRALLGTW